MKKIFTLFVALIAFAAVGSAKMVIPFAFNPWGAGCECDATTQTITFSKAWKGAGNWLNYVDLSDYDCIVLKFAEPTVGSMKICAQYGKPKGTVDANGNPEYDIEGAWDTVNENIIPGSKIIKVDLNPDHSDKVAQFWVQSKEAGCKMVIAEIYAGTEDEYQADLEGNAPEIPERVDLTLSDLGSGWGDSTYDAATKTITIGQDWSGKGWWLGDVDYSHYSAVVIEFAEATTANGKVVVESEAGSNGDDGLFDVSCLVKVVPLAPGADHTKQVYIQGPAETQYKLAAAYVATADYISTNGIVDKYADTEGIHDMKAESTVKDGAIYNLAGQRVNATFKGVVIQNGHKFIQK